MSASHQREAAIFDAAMELPPERRSGYLDEACGEDAALRRRVDSLLKACESQCVFLDAPAREIAAAGTARLPVSEKPGETIGRYKLLEQIGEGGCGVVHVAEQAEPVRRRVALKIIKLGMDTRSVIARFEAERQALAMMDHPNIAKVLDAGATETGRPYFVMELVRGMRITDYCDQAKLSTRARLDLFVHVCQAIQHAHQKGIIHRDIKPSNILVTVNDGVPVPKVIDFGIAKATAGQQLTEKTIYTAFEQFIGTPAYMSPEQAVLTSLDIDTRSDIYALGVLLYELLTGRTPFDAKELLAIGLDEMRRTIREQEPPRPSTCLSTLPDHELSTTAQRRGLEAPKLVSELRGDLDWIVMKALEKDRSRRYETANGLAADIQRHLNNEPVFARPPSRLYRLQKTVQRNKLAFSSAAAVGIALMAGVIVTAWQAQRARAERDSAHTVLRFFSEHILAAGRPEGQEGGLGKDVTLRKAIDAAEPQIAASLQNRPLVEAAIRHTLGKSYQFLGEPALAVRQVERAVALRRQHLGSGHEDTLESINILSDVYNSVGSREQGIALLEDALQPARRTLGPEHRATVQTMASLCGLYGAARNIQRAKTIGEEALKVSRARFGASDTLTCEILNNLGLANVFAGKPREAIPILTEALKLQRARLGPEGLDVCPIMHNLASAYFHAGKPDEAAALYDEVFRVTKAKVGPHHPNTLRNVRAFLEVLLHEKRYDAAEKLISEVASSGDEGSPPPASVFRLRADVRARRARFAEAAADLARVRDAYPEEHLVWHELAALLAATDQLDAYREHCRRSVEKFGNSTDPQTAERIAKDCLILPASGADLDVVAKMAVTAGAAGRDKPDSWFQLVNGLAEYRRGHFISAVEWANKALTKEGKDLRRDLQAYMVLAMAHHQLKRTDEARAVLAKGIRIEGEKLPKLESGDIGGYWVDWIIAHALMREAKGLIETRTDTSE